MKTLELIEYLKTQKEETEWIYKKKKTKAGRSLNQNNLFYQLFTDIWNHLWEEKDDVHDMMLWWTFWTHTVKIWRIEKEILNEKHTSKLTKEQGIKFIDTMIKFCEKYDIPVTVTSREIKSLYESYN